MNTPAHDMVIVRLYRDIMTHEWESMRDICVRTGMKKVGIRTPLNILTELGLVESRFKRGMHNKMCAEFRLTGADEPVEKE